MTWPPPVPPHGEPHDPAETSKPGTGRILAGRYRLQDMLGGGGMAWVYRARDLKLDRDVAVKILRPQYAGRPDFRARFLEEARLAAKLNHPNLVTIYDVGEEGDTVFMVMEYVPGHTLAWHIRHEAPMALEDALYLMVQACAGVGYIHRAGLVHGDLKPSNLLVLPDRRLKVTDFGLAGAIGVLLTEETEEGRRFVWGSPRYLSPEHARGDPILPASDVYALGLLLYEMLTGHLPYRARTTEEWVRAHAQDASIPPRQWRPELPERLEQVLLKVLDKRPSRRFRTADHLGRVLLLFTEREETRAVSLPEAQKTVQVPLPETPPPTTSPSPPTPTSSIPQPVPPTGSFVRPMPQYRPTPSSTFTDILDPLTLLLGLLAALAIAGLIPLWVWVYLLYSR